MRRADAAASFSVSGSACVADAGADALEEGAGPEGGGGVSSLLKGLELRVWVDGVEEAATTDASMHFTLPDLSSGSHMLLAQVVNASEPPAERDPRGGGGGRQAVVALAQEIVVLRDVEILFPSEDFVFGRGQKIVLAIGVAPSALERALMLL